MTTLLSSPLFQSLNPAELRDLQEIAQEQNYCANQEIIRAGEPGDGVYFVKTGVVEISAGHGNARVFSLLGPTEIFGEMAIIENRPRSATAKAVEPTVVYFLPRKQILDLLERSPSLKQALLQQISQRLRAFNQVHVRELVQSEHLAMIGRLVQGIVHDLRGPLNLINLSADALALDEHKVESRVKTQNRIRKQVLRINDLVSDILIYTQGPAATDSPPEVNFASFVRDLAVDLEEEVSMRSCRWEISNPPPHAWVCMDPRRLSRVFFNLVTNATDMMPEGGRIILGFEEEAGEIITSLADTGPGIAPQIADTLFQPFSTHGKTRGTGLGLAICKKIIEEHGGRIWVKTSTKHGATFCFALPISRPGQEPDPVVAGQGSAKMNKP